VSENRHCGADSESPRIAAINADNAEQQHAFRHAEFGRNGVGGRCFGHEIDSSDQETMVDKSPQSSPGSEALPALP
jgi:hypothetical protein